MLSVCVPVFEYDVRKLINDLFQQLQQAGHESEIIIIDDFSGNSFKEQYKEIQNEKTKIVVLDKNIGRAGIRNLFLQYARYDNLLFLDCDSQIIKADFLKNYFVCIQNKYAVICGGRVYPPKFESRKYALHWEYGIFRESKMNTVVKPEPNRSFMTNNFMIRKEIFQKNHFNEKLYAYGHEDTLLGFELMKVGIQIEHINNPLLHGRLETNREFLAKTISGIKNLLVILDQLNQDKEFISNVSLLKTFFGLKKQGLYPILYFIAPFFIPIISATLNAGIINLRLFDFFKLLVLSRLYRKQKKRK